MVRVTRAGCSIFLAIFVCIAFGQADVARNKQKSAGVSVGYRASFIGQDQQPWSAPTIVSVENTGPDDGLQLSTVTGGGTQDYALDLPSGTKKQFDAYFLADVSAGQNPSLLIRSRQLVQDQPVEGVFAQGYSNVSLIGVITDSPGVLGFIKADGNKSASGPPPDRLKFGDLYCKIDEAPTRSWAYSGFDSIVLGEQAERMSDDAVLAVQRYVLAGGTVVFTGGASPTVMRDARWAPLLAADPGGAGTEPTPHYFRQAGFSLPSVPFVHLDLRPGTSLLIGSKDVPVMVSRVVGLGRVVQISVDPFREPFRGWAGNRDLFLTVPGSSLRQLEGNGEGSYVPYGSRLSRSMAARPVAALPVSSNVFHARLPDPIQVLCILLAYVVVVGPVNFGLLSLFKKPQWGWLTSPAISLAFSFIFFSFAADLYKSGAARMSDGYLSFEEGFKPGVFYGGSTLFIPSAGHYDLKLKGIEYLGPKVSEYEYGSRKRAGVSGLADTGQIRAKDIDFPSLSFREYRVCQAVPPRSWEIGHDFRVEGSKVYGALTNGSPYELANAVLVYRGQGLALGDVKPGQTVKCEGSLEQVPALIPVEVPGLTLQAKVTGDGLGPQVGNVAEEKSVTFCYTFKDGVGAR